MSNGRIEQVGAPEEVYANPANEFVIRFLGNVNEIACHVRGGRVLLPGVSLGKVDLAAAGDGPAALYVRPQDVAVARDPGGRATVKSVSAAGPFARIEAELNGTTLPIEAMMPHEALEPQPIAPGDRISLYFRRARAFPRDPQHAAPDALGLADALDKPTAVPAAGLVRKTA